MSIFSYKNKSILIVDDQKAFHVMLKTMLTNQGALNIDCIDNAETAIKLAKRVIYDIYLIDYNLGSGKNGSQLIHYLRNNKIIPNTSICFIISGDNNKEMVLTAIETAPDDYLIKPFSQKQLFNRISNAIQKKMLLADVFNALEEKNYPAAIALCKNKINSKTKFRGLCKNLLANILIQDKNYQAAEEILLPLIAQRLLIRPAINLGKTYYLQKKYFDAIQLLSKIIERAPLQMEAYQWLARSYQECGDCSEALSILSHAANMTHHSIERHQEVALLASEMHEHKVMLSSYAAILQLSRHSFYPDPCHLANYIRCIINYAKEEENITERKTILKKVNSTLYQSRFEEGQNKDFDFNNFDKICQANVLLALNQPLKAKRKILNILHNVINPIAELDDTFLCESTFSLLDIGEFDFAEPYLDELKLRDIVDPTTQKTIKEQTGKTLETRIYSFKAQNKLGIQAFTAQRYDNALGHFNQALNLEPMNSGAMLNRLQVYIRLLMLTNKHEQGELLHICQSNFTLLNNTHLSEEHSKRYHELKKEFNQIT